MTRKSTCSKELRNTSKSASLYSQAQRASGSMNHAQSAKTKPKAYWFLRTQHQVLKRFMQILTAQRATRRAQSGKCKLKTRRVSAQSARKTKQHAWGFEKPRTKVHKRRKPVKAWTLNLKRRTDVYLWLLYLFENMHSKYPTVKPTIIIIIIIFHNFYGWPPKWFLIIFHINSGIHLSMCVLYLDLLY